MRCWGVRSGETLVLTHSVLSTETSRLTTQLAERRPRLI
jgi:hypothetical protein